MKSLSIHGRRWFNRTCGNTYFSAYALVDGLTVEGIGFKYGYGNQYEWEMLRKLAADGRLPVPIQEHESAWRYCERNGITYVSDVVDVRRKKDL